MSLQDDDDNDDDSDGDDADDAQDKHKAKRVKKPSNALYLFSFHCSGYFRYTFFITIQLVSVFTIVSYVVVFFGTVLTIVVLYLILFYMSARECYSTISGNNVDDNGRQR